MTYCTACENITRSAVRRSSKHPDYLINEVIAILPDITAGKILGPGNPDGTGPCGPGRRLRIKDAPCPIRGRQKPKQKPKRKKAEDEIDEADGAVDVV